MAYKIIRGCMEWTILILAFPLYVTLFAATSSDSDEFKSAMRAQYGLDKKKEWS